VIHLIRSRGLAGGDGRLGLARGNPFLPVGSGLEREGGVKEPPAGVKNP